VLELLDRDKMAGALIRLVLLMAVAVAVEQVKLAVKAQVFAAVTAVLECYLVSRALMLTMQGAVAVGFHRN